MKLFIPAILLLILCGCSSPTRIDSGANSRPIIGADAATVFFFREKCPPVAVKGTLIIDGVEYFAVPIRRYTSVRVAPGSHELKFAFPVWGGIPSKKLAIETGPNTTRYFYYTTDMGFVAGAPVATTTITPELIEITEEKAKKLMTEFERIP